MGTWGPGNFDDDTAADHLSTVTSSLLDEIVAAMARDERELEPDDYWRVAVPCNVELLALLAVAPASPAKRARETQERFIAWKKKRRAGAGEDLRPPGRASR